MRRLERLLCKVWCEVFVTGLGGTLGICEGCRFT